MLSALLNLQKKLRANAPFASKTKITGFWHFIQTEQPRRAMRSREKNFKNVWLIASIACIMKSNFFCQFMIFVIFQKKMSRNNLSKIKLIEKIKWSCSNLLLICYCDTCMTARHFFFWILKFLKIVHTIFLALPLPV